MFGASLGRFTLPKFLNLPINPPGVLGVEDSIFDGPDPVDKSSGEAGVPPSSEGCRMRVEK